jgi:transcriptional regulator with XRE-family HTH domain
LFYVYDAMKINHQQFTTRLRAAIDHAGITQAELASRIGVDRSSLSQFLSPTAERFPRVETLAALATALTTSMDWLLGLTTDDPNVSRTDLVDESLAFENVSGEPVDERLVGWLVESRGQKVRYVPSTLPDVLKTDVVIRHERMAIIEPEVRIENASIKLAWQRTPEADVECVSSIQSLEAFARGEDIWKTLSLPRRLEQLERMAELADELYPSFRWYLVDRRQRYTAPVTIFGRRRAAMYIGAMYVVFNTPAHVNALVSHFDGHLRSATVEPRQISSRIRKLITSTK